MGKLENGLTLLSEIIIYLLIRVHTGAIKTTSLTKRGLTTVVNGWIQTLLREKVKNQSYINLTSYSKTSSKIRLAFEI